VRFVGTCYRAHNPRWSFAPLSGDGAAIHGGRFNPKGTPALYLATTIMTAIKEANQGFARKIDPCVLCSYSVDCAGIVDLTDADERAAHAVAVADLACPWFGLAAAGGTPPSWRVAIRLKASGAAGILVPSHAPGVTDEDRNLVLWRWGPDPPCRVSVDDPSGRLPKNQLSWT
jgi:RES domain-containing protein